MPFTFRNLKEDLEDVGSNFDGGSDLEFRLASGKARRDDVEGKRDWWSG